MRRLSQIGGSPTGYHYWVDPYDLLLLTLGILVALSVIGLVLPMRVAKVAKRPPVRELSYFAAIGLGFILLEVVLIQRFVLFLGFPTYALSVVLFALLLFTGLGSAISARIGKTRRALLTVLAASAGLIVLSAFTLQPILQELISLPFAARIGVTILVLAPLGLALGMPMPIGLSQFAMRHPDGVAFAWGVNGVASVLASVLGIVIAINFGFSTASLVAAACYAAAIALAARTRRVAPEPVERQCRRSWFPRWSRSRKPVVASRAQQSPSIERIVRSVGQPLRIVQWTTGNVGREAVAAIVARPDLDLVGVFAHDPAKVGRDAADLCGLDEPTGVLATADVGALLALHPDCVVYAALHIDVDEVERILRAGVNVVTTSEFLTGAGIGAAATATLEAAATDRRVDALRDRRQPRVRSAVRRTGRRHQPRRPQHHAHGVRRRHHVRQRPQLRRRRLGPPGRRPRSRRRVEQATIVFGDGLEVLAALLGLTLDERRCTVSFAHATEDLHIPGMVIAKGHVAGMDVHWDGIVDGVTRLGIHQRWVIGDRVEPAMPVEFGYVVEVAGDPNLRIKLDLWPDADLAAMDVDDFRAIGMRITAVPTVNAIPVVCAARAGHPYLRRAPGDHDPHALTDQAPCRSVQRKRRASSSARPERIQDRPRPAC